MAPLGPTAVSGMQHARCGVLADLFAHAVVAATVAAHVRLYDVIR